MLHGKHQLQANVPRGRHDPSGRILLPTGAGHTTGRLLRGRSSTAAPASPISRLTSSWEALQRQTKSHAGKFSPIGDNYETLDQVQTALREAGLESSNLIVAVDFTKSNEWSGARSFQNRSLHALASDELNPYQQAISIIARALEGFDEDNLIPAIGFGDVTTQDTGVFHFFPGGAPANGLTELACRYWELVPNVKLSGPTSFAPAIHQAMQVVADSGCQYHILVIIADGQVIGNQEAESIDAIVAASELPLSILMVGVGDGPWGVMKDFDDKLPARRFDNFQFVNFTELASRNVSKERLEAEFALRALMEVPEQFKAVQKLGLLGKKVKTPIPKVRVLEPPGPAPLGAVNSIKSWLGFYKPEA